MDLDGDTFGSGEEQDRLFNMASQKYIRWRWLHPNISGPQAEQVLRERGRDGSFLVRPSRTLPGDYVIDVREQDQITHIRVHHTGEFFDLYGGERFATLSEMVECYYNDEAVEKLQHADGNAIVLRYPLPAHDNGTSERWFHANVSGSDAENWLREKGHVGSFLVRLSRRNPGNYVLSVRCETKVLHILVRPQAGKYSVEDSADEFDSIKALLRHYQQNPMVDKTGINVYLAQPFNSTRIKACQISERVQLLEELNIKQKSGYAEEFELLHVEECQLPFLREEGKKPENRPKNRYKNILPFDHTRVILKDGDPNIPGSDYINADFIESEEDLSDDPKRYIATQGCNDASVVDFYRMLWQEKCNVIIMATELIEKVKKKCAPYWPGATENVPEVMTLKVYKGELTIRLAKETDFKIYILRELAVTREQEGSTETRKIFQFHFKKWPDHGVPIDPNDINRLLDAANSKRESQPDVGPLVIHCSAGIGRTGSLIMVDMIRRSIDQLGIDREIDIFETLKSCRKQRSGCVQTTDQYRLIYKALECAIKAKEVEYNSCMEPVYENVSSKSRNAMVNGNDRAAEKNRGTKGKRPVAKKKK